MANIGYLQVTRRCNQKCLFCSNPERDADASLSEGLAHIDRLKREGYICVLFTGGEPTMSDLLPEFIRHCAETGFMHKLCTNAQKLADAEYLKMLADAGLRHVCISFHSCRPDVQDFLANNPDSHENIMHALKNLQRYPHIAVDILTTINKHNADHLSENVIFLLERLPAIKHLTWNNLDPRMNRTAENPGVIPTLNDFEVELNLAMDILDARGVPFQVERVPLCYMARHAHRSTETRRIVKREERLTYFLDERGLFRWADWGHDKADCCAACPLNEICAGLYQMDVFYSSRELFPVFVSKEKIIRAVLEGD